MQLALEAQESNGNLLNVRVQATDTSGIQQTFTGELRALPFATTTEYRALTNHELVQRRINELLAARLQLQIREAALRGD